MWIEKLRLTHFKNHEEGLFSFGERVNCVVGPNGSGKTNLLDAIYFLALTKSARHNQDALCVQHEAPFFLLDGIFLKNQQRTQITCSFQVGQRKVLQADKKNYERLSDHIGQFPVVLVAPDDTDLVRQGSEERRRFFDGVMSQLDPAYLSAFLHYNKLLAQRNSLLKLFAERNYLDEVLLDTYSTPLVTLAQQIHRQREGFMEQFVPLFQQYYAYLSNAREGVTIYYESDLASPDFVADFARNRARDLAAQRTGMGVHKDDFVFELGGVALKKFGSQGQQKSFVIALKLAQYALLAKEKGSFPILLLDDIFDKLDDRRIQKLMRLIDDGEIGQVFITDARPERSRRILEQVQADVRFIEIEPS